MAVLIALYAIQQGLGVGGQGADAFFQDWVNDGLLWVAAVACLGGALRSRRSRAAWVVLAVALAAWAAGDTIESIRFGHRTAPLTSVSDIFWLAWYPLVVAALVLLVRDRVPGFDLYRWIDGVAVMLVVATPWVALFLEPVLAHSHTSALGRAVQFVYPIGDAVLFGATLGVYVLMAWRPSAMWVALGIGLMVIAVADANYSVYAAMHHRDHGVYDAAWAGGAALIAYAAWRPHPGQLEPRALTGWSAIALPLVAQVLAAAIQIYAVFHTIPPSERIMTAIVLIIAMVQIIISRPRASADRGSNRDLVRPPP
jgi:hypothetical protein